MYQLGKIEVQGGTEDAALGPRLVSDADGTYNGFANEGKLHHTDGSWDRPFDPAVPYHSITEGIPWQYTFFVPQNVPGLIDAVGGKGQFIAKLDGLFNRKLYAQGNEPSHAIAFLYDAAGAPWKTQERIRAVMAEYDSTVNGLPGNDDDGQMSAWYVLSAMGFYPVCPGGAGVLGRQSDLRTGDAASGGGARRSRSWRRTSRRRTSTFSRRP